ADFEKHYHKRCAITRATAIYVAANAPVPYFCRVMKRTAWFERTFPVLEDNGLLPAIIERLSGTPARLGELVSQLAPAVLTSRPVHKWTIKEQIGHLSDVESLWLGRVEDLVNGAADLRVAVLGNRQTYTANHNATDLPDLLQRFR